ncbi:proline hydroxylase, partial [Burkholderia thailandensis]|nr:proline hydroxylase [Burkholderia thailandensis]
MRIVRCAIQCTPPPAVATLGDVTRHHGYDNRGALVKVADLPSDACDIVERIGTLDWPAIETELGRQGCALVPRLLSASACDALASLYPRDTLY